MRTHQVIGAYGFIDPKVVLPFGADAKAWPNDHIDPADIPDAISICKSIR